MNVIRKSLGLVVAGLLVAFAASPVVPERNSDGGHLAAVPASVEHGSWQADLESEGRKLADIETEGRKLADIETEGRKLADVETEGRKLADVGHETEGRQLT